MTRRPVALLVPSLLAVALAVAGCAAAAGTHPPSDPTETRGVAPSPTSGPSPTPSSPGPVASVPPGGTMLPSTRVEGRWLVIFGTAGSASREIFDLTSTCESGPCTIRVEVQTPAGEPIGSDTFAWNDGRYRLDTIRERRVNCRGSAGTMLRNGALVTTTTELWIAAYKPEGSAVVSPRIFGWRRIATVPINDSGCAGGEVLLPALGGPA